MSRLRFSASKRANTVSVELRFRRVYVEASTIRCRPTKSSFRSSIGESSCRSGGKARAVESGISPGRRLESVDPAFADRFRLGTAARAGRDYEHHEVALPAAHHERPRPLVDPPGNAALCFEVA